MAVGTLLPRLEEAKQECESLASHDETTGRLAHAMEIRMILLMYQVFIAGDIPIAMRRSMIKLIDTESRPPQARGRSIHRGSLS